MPVTERHERDYKNQIVLFVYPKPTKNKQGIRFLDFKAM